LLDDKGFSEVLLVFHFVAARGSLGVRHRGPQRPASAQATFFHQAGARVSVATVDDAWLFVDGRLAVDLGGLGPKTGGVALDALSLVPGQQYKLALFTARRCVFLFARRHPYLYLVRCLVSS